MSPRSLPLLVLVALLSQCDKPAPSPPAAVKPLATVAGTAITEEDLKNEANRRLAEHEPVPAPEVLLDEMVERLVMVEQARQAGLDREPATRRRLESLLIARLRETRVEPEIAAIVVSDEEVDAAYQARLEEFSRPALDRFAILFQAVGEKSSEARRAEARERIEAGLARAAEQPAAGGRGPAASGFGAVAIDFSDDQVSRYRGGDLGWLDADAALPRIPGKVLEAGRALGKGSRSGVIEAADGYYAIMKTDSRPGGATPLGEVSGKLRQTLLQEKQRAAKEQFIAAARAATSIEIDSAAVREVALPVLSPPSPLEDSPPAFPAASR